MEEEIVAEERDAVSTKIQNYWHYLLATCLIAQSENDRYALLGAR